MNNSILVVVLAVWSFGGYCATVTPRVENVSHKDDGLSTEERRALWEKNFMKRYGGFCEQPGSQQGKVIFVDAQKKVDGDFIKAQVAAIEDFSRIKTEYVQDAAASISTASTGIRTRGAQMAVYVVDDPKLPALLTAPEAKWAFVNVAFLSADGAEISKVQKRVRKELWRAFAYTAGCGDSNDGRSVVQAVSTLADLDAIVVENFDPIQMQGLLHSMKKIGVTPKHIAPYKTACIRGWAPAPTNEYQKAIWDKVHAPPKTPMKIEFDPKKGK